MPNLSVDGEPDPRIEPLRVGAGVDALRWSGATRVTTGQSIRLDVTGLLPGETAQVQPDPYGRATVLELLTASPRRIDPRCQQFDDCPGCPLRGLPTPYRRQLTDPLHHRALSGLAGEAPWRRLPSAADDGGRARAVARALRDGDGRLVLGMARRGCPPVRLGECPLQNEASRAVLARLERELRALAVEPWDSERREGVLRHVIVHGIGPSTRVILALDTHAADPPFDRLLVDEPQTALLVDRLPRRGAGLVHRPRPVRGDPMLRFSIGDDRFRAGPRSWVPQAPATVPAIQRAVIDGSGSRPTDDVIEVGCGVGLLSLPLARRVRSLIGIDIERGAVLDAEANAAENGVTNATFRTGEAAHALRRLLARGARADLVVMHAMRRPFGPEAMGAVRALAPRRIVCLSPFAPALARDLAALPRYSVEEVALCDQTPGSVPDLAIVTLRRG